MVLHHYHHCGQPASKKSHSKGAWRNRPSHPPTAGRVARRPDGQEQREPGVPYFYVMRPATSPHNKRRALSWEGCAILTPPPGSRADRTSEPTWLIPHWNAPALGSDLPASTGPAQALPCAEEACPFGLSLRTKPERSRRGQGVRVNWRIPTPERASTPICSVRL